VTYKENDSIGSLGMSSSDYKDKSIDSNNADDDSEESSQAAPIQSPNNNKTSEFEMV
jgi:hypothetical protein